MGSDGRNGMEGSDAIIDTVLGELREGYGDTYPDELYDATKAYLERWLVSLDGRGGMVAEDLLPLPEDFRESVAFGGAQSYMVGYATGLDGDYMPDTVTVGDILVDMDSDTSIIDGMARRLADTYPTRMIVRAAAHCATFIDIGLSDEYGNDDDDDETANELASVVRACFKAFCLGCEDGEAALATGRLPNVEGNDALCTHLVVRGCLSAVSAAFDDDDGTTDGGGTPPIAIVAIADGSNDGAKTLQIPMPPDVAERGRFSYDSESGKVTYEFDVDDVPDFMNGVSVESVIARHVTLYALQESGYYAGLSDGNMRNIGKIISDDATSHDGDAPYDDITNGAIGPNGVYALVTGFLPTFDGFVRSRLLHPSGVYEDGYMENATSTASTFASAYMHGLIAAITGDVNAHDTELPAGIPFDSVGPLRIARDEVGTWCTKNGIADWAYVAAVIELADAYMDGIRDARDDADAADEDSAGDGKATLDDDDKTPLSMVWTVASQSKTLTSLGIGFASGIVTSGMDGVKGKPDANVSWL